MRHIYLVQSGFVRCCSYTPEGTRHISAFARQGDLIGFPELGSAHRTAEAIGHVTALCLPAEALETALMRDRRLAIELREYSARCLDDRERNMMWLSSLQSEDRLLAFLRAFAPLTRTSDGFSHLPMSRRDIADHLAMSHETVSRAIGALKGRGLLWLRTGGCYKVAPSGNCATAA